MFKHVKCGQTFRYLGALLVHNCPMAKTQKLTDSDWLRRQRHQDWLRFGK